MRKGVLSKAPAKKPAFCETNPCLSFPDGVIGYRIRHRQDHGGYPFKTGKEGIYLVKHGLSFEEKKSVALAIFMEVSLKFEALQAM